MSVQGTKSTRVLFIGIVHDGKVVQERALAAGEDVTVGPAAKASFPVEDAGLDEPFLLFTVRDGVYRLRFDKKVKGRITSRGEKVDLAKPQPELTNDEGGDVASVALNDADKGKLKIGSVTVLFKFVDQPAAAPPPPPLEKLDFRPRFFFDDDDPIFTRSLGFWAALALVFAVWVRTTEPPPLDVEKMSKRVITIAKIEKPAEVVAPIDEGQKPEEKSDDAVAEAEKTKQADKTDEKPKTEVERAAKVEAAKQDLQQQSALFRELQARLIGTAGMGKSSLITSGGDYQGLGADLAAAEAAGRSNGDGSSLRAGTVVAGAAGDKEIGPTQMGTAGRANLGDAPKIPVASVKTEDVDVGGGSDATNVEKVVRKYQGQLKYCYETSLKADPSLEGRVVVGWDVSGGAASDAYIVENTTGDAKLADCIVSKVRRWSFEGVDDGEAKSTFVFTPQN